MTVNEVAKKILGEDATFDCALPQDWVNNVKELTDMHPPGNMVWYYPKEGPGKLFGYPVAVSDDGRRCLGLIALRRGLA